MDRFFKVRPHLFLPNIPPSLHGNAGARDQLLPARCVVIYERGESVGRTVFGDQPQRQQRLANVI
jgi:hypothetical protein